MHVRKKVHVKKPTNGHLFLTPLYYHVLLRHVSALRGPSSESTTDTFPQQGQQNMYQMLNAVS